MIDLTIPDEVWDAVAAAVPIESVVAAEGSAWDISTLVQRGVEAAAPLIVAAELDRIADEIGAAATLAHESAGEDAAAALAAVADLSIAARLRARACALSGEGRHVPDSDDELPGMWSHSDLSGGWADTEGGRK